MQVVAEPDEFGRLGAARPSDDTITEAVEAACHDLRTPDANTTQEEGRKLMQVANACDVLVDAHGDAIEQAFMDNASAHDACGRLVSVCYAKDEL